MISSRIFFYTLALVLVICGNADNAFGVVRRDDQSDSQYRKEGNRAAFNPVGRVEIDYGTGFAAIGTATLYGRDRIVSAAHVFDDSALDGAQRIRINFGKGHIRTINFQETGVVNLNPRYNSLTLRNDVSVAFLAKPFNLSPAKLYTGKKLRLDTKITFVGYGSTGTGLTGSRIYSTAKRAGENALGRYIYAGSDFEVDFDRPGTSRYNSLGSAAALRLEGLLGPGDSGGSAWVYKNKQWKLVGINSYGLDWFPGNQGNGIEDDYGDRSGFVYLPRYQKWLASLQHPDFASRQGRSLAASPVPEPRTLLLLSLAAALLPIFRRRTRGQRLKA